MDKIKKYTYIPNILSKDERNFFWNYAKMFHRNNHDYRDNQTLLEETVRYGDPVAESLLLFKKEYIEKHINDKLTETYSYWRIYNKFSSLEKHVDRESCEYTVSITVAADKEWPLYIEDESCVIKPGDGIIYDGCNHEHWRDEYDGDYSCQVFFHYVKKNGKFEHLKYDRRPYLGLPHSFRDQI